MLHRRNMLLGGIVGLAMTLPMPAGAGSGQYLCDQPPNCDFEPYPTFTTHGMAFDSVAPGTAFPFGATYTESGMTVTSYSEDASFGDPIGGVPESHRLYFHGSPASLQFGMADRSRFDLYNFSFLIGVETADLWIATSAGAYVPFPSSFLPLQAEGGLYTSAAPGFSDLDWFRIGTSRGAIEIDNVAFVATPMPEPSVFALLGVGLGAVAMLRRRSQK